jgi:hypothetical protein
MSCVLLKPLVKEGGKAHSACIARAQSVLLDCFEQRIGCLLPGFKATLRSLDPLPRWRAAGKERVAPGGLSARRKRFVIVPVICLPPKRIRTKMARLGC